VAQKELDRRAICEHNLRKLLFTNTFILVECRCRDGIWRRQRITFLCNFDHVKYPFCIINEVI